MNKMKDTVKLNKTEKLPYYDVRIDDFDANNIVISEDLRTPNNSQSGHMRFTFAYYMHKGRPHHFTVNVFGEKGYPIKDIALVRMETNMDSTIKIDNRAILEANYASDDIHRKIVNLLQSVQDRINDILSRNPGIAKYFFDDKKAKSISAEISKYLKNNKTDDPNEYREEVWRRYLDEYNTYDRFISKSIFKTELTDLDGEEDMVEVRDEDGNLIINDTFPIFFNFKQRQFKDSDKFAPSIIDKNRNKYTFDDFKGNICSFAKISLRFPMITLLANNSMKIHKDMTGGFILGCEKMGVSIDSYGNDVDPSLYAGTSLNLSKDNKGNTDDSDEDLVDADDFEDGILDD